MIIIGLDPGSKNFGFSVSEITGSKLTVLEIGQIESTVSNLTNNIAYKRITKGQRAKAKAKGKRLVLKEQPATPPFMDGLKKFDKTTTKLFNEYKPDLIIAERFQTRGIKGTTIEAVSIMLGVISLYCSRKKVLFNLTTAATWKNQVNRIITLDDFYVGAKENGFTPHECDAFIMSIYAVSKEIGDLDKWTTKAETSLTRYARKLNANSSM